MHSLVRVARVTVGLSFAARLSLAACVPENSPSQPNGDAVARLLATQPRCPLTALEFRGLLERSGARLDTTMVNFRGFHNPGDGAFFLFEIVSGMLPASPGPVERGDLLFGHFLRRRGSTLVPFAAGLLVEAIAWDPAKQLFNFYELTDQDGPLAWRYRGDSALILDDTEHLYRERTVGQAPFKNQLRCSGCHVNGGLVQKELASPHNDWWVKSRPLPMGTLKPDSDVAKILQGLVDADELTKLVEATSRRLSASPELRKALRARTMQEQLRPLFCPVEVNIESDREPFDERKPTLEISAGFFADPRLGVQPVSVPRSNYEQALKDVHASMPGAPGRKDADHAWLAPVKGSSDIAMTDALVESRVIDDEFVADVLAVDFTSPLFSARRCGLLKQVPEQGGPDFLARFEASLRTSEEPAAKVLLENLTDPKRDAAFHRQQVRSYLEACQVRASEAKASAEWLDLLVQRRAQVDTLEVSKHPQGHILESPDRFVFPKAPVLSGSLEMTPACEVRRR